MSYTILKTLELQDKEIKMLKELTTRLQDQISSMRQEFYELLKKVEIIEAAVEELRNAANKG